MAKIYTKKGDQGETCLVSGEKVLKSHLRLETYGTLDELNSCIGVAFSHMNLSPQKKKIFKTLGNILTQIQNDLFNIGSQLACADPKLQKKLPNITDDDVLKLEEVIDDLTEIIPPLKNFILPGGSISSSALHVARTVCRRAERLCIKLRDSNTSVEPTIIHYLNRLSDLLFVIARFCNKTEGFTEVEWKSK
jgi:cob(I)alamin adenosyltransferase